MRPSNVDFEATYEIPLTRPGIDGTHVEFGRVLLHLTRKRTMLSIPGHELYWSYRVRARYTNNDGNLTIIDPLHGDVPDDVTIEAENVDQGATTLLMRLMDWRALPQRLSQEQREWFSVVVPHLQAAERLSQFRLDDPLPELGDRSSLVRD